MSGLINLIGKRFGRLVVIERAGVRKSHVLWKCKCDCGNETITWGLNLRHSRTKSCGCLHKERVREMGLGCATHGHCRRSGELVSSKTYISWSGMKKRCNYKNYEHYPLYGGRGIQICKEWEDFGNFLKDMGERPEGTSLDRIDSDGNYEPSNCRWVSYRMQTSNRNKEVYIKNLIYNGNEGFSVDISRQNNAFI